MGTKVVLAPRNSAEAVALGVSACFLAVAGVVVHGDVAVERSSAGMQNLAAQVQDLRTVSRPSSQSENLGSRLPSVLVPEPPLVLLPVEEQAEAKIAAAGTPRGAGVVLVAWSRGAGTLSLGGGLTGVGAVPTSSASRPNGAVTFPSTAAPGTVSAAPAVTTPPTPSGTTEPPPVETTAPPVETTAPPVETTAPPVETTQPPVETTPPPVETTQPPVQTTPPPPQTTAPTTNPGVDGGTTDSAPGATTSGADPTSGSSEQGLTTPVVPDPSVTVVAPGPTPQSLQD